MNAGVRWLHRAVVDGVRGAPRAERGVGHAVCTRRRRLSFEGKNETFGIVTQSPKVQRWRARNARVHLGGRPTFAPAISASVSADPS